MSDDRKLPGDDYREIGEYLEKLRNDYGMDKGQSIRVLYIIEHTDLGVEQAKQIQDVMVKHQFSLDANGVKKAQKLKQFLSY